MPMQPLAVEETCLVAIDAVRAAAKVVVAIRSMKDMPVFQKPDSSPVTAADIAAQLVINHHILSRYPNDLIIAEEDASQLEDPAVVQIIRTLVCPALDLPEELEIKAFVDLLEKHAYHPDKGQRPKRFWSVDPIDGTKGFLRNEQFACCIALVEDDQVKVAAMACPNLLCGSELGTLFWAQKDHGAFMCPLSRAVSNGQPIQCKAATFQEAVMAESLEGKHSSQSKATTFRKALGMTAEPIKMDSQCKYGIVARGDAQIYFRQCPDQSYREKIWDHATGYLFVKEAGGTVTDLHGQDLRFGPSRYIDVNGIVASSYSAIEHAKLLATGFNGEKK